MSKGKGTKKSGSKWPVVVGGVVALGLGVSAISNGQQAAGAAAGSSTTTTTKPAASKQGSAGLSKMAQQCLPIGRALKRAEWPDVATGVSIAAAETKCKNINNAGLNKDGTVDYCEMQINNIHKKDVSTIDKCAKAAVQIRKAQGVRAWSSVNNGSAAKFNGVGREVAGAI